MDNQENHGQQAGKSKWLMGVLQLVFVIGVIALALVFSSTLKPKQSDRGSSGFSTNADTGISVSITNPQPQVFTPQVRLNGIIAAQTQINIAPQIGGQVIRVSEGFKQGATVKKGQTLFQIEPRDFQLAVEQAEANISAARSDLKILEAEAELAIREYQELFPNQQITDLAARKPQMAAAQARLDGAKASKQTASLALSRTIVRAPDDMKILATSLNKGQIVAPNQSVGQAFAIKNIEISAPLSTSELETLSPVVGRVATLLGSSATSTTRTGKVVRVNAVLDARTRLANLFISPDTSDDLIVGNFIDVVIDGPKIERALALPESAMAGRDTVWVISNGVLRSRNVRRLGQQSDHVLVADFDTGNGVLTLPPIEVFEGQKAKIRGTSK